MSQPCFFGEQCAGSPYTSCLREKCSCIEGYTAMNSTDCTQSICLFIFNLFEHDFINAMTQRVFTMLPYIENLYYSDFDIKTCVCFLDFVIKI